MPLNRFCRLALLFACLCQSNAYAQEKNADACSESNQQGEFRAELIKAFSFERYGQPKPLASWTMVKGSPTHSCEVSCRNNDPYDNFYLTYKGYETNGKPCTGETSVTSTGVGLVKQITSCMVGCGPVTKDSSTPAAH